MRMLELFAGIGGISNPLNQWDRLSTNPLQFVKVNEVAVYEPMAIRAEDDTVFEGAFPSVGGLDDVVGITGGLIPTTPHTPITKHSNQSHFIASPGRILLSFFKRVGEAFVPRAEFNGFSDVSFASRYLCRSFSSLVLVARNEFAITPPLINLGKGFSATTSTLNQHGFCLFLNSVVMAEDEAPFSTLFVKFVNFLAATTLTLFGFHSFHLLLHYTTNSQQWQVKGGLKGEGFVSFFRHRWD